MKDLEKLTKEELIEKIHQLEEENRKNIQFLRELVEKIADHSGVLEGKKEIDTESSEEKKAINVVEGIFDLLGYEVSKVTVEKK